MTTRRHFVAATGCTLASAFGFSSCGGSGSPTAPGPANPGTPPPTAAEARIPLMAVGETVATSVTLVGALVTPLAVTRMSGTQVVAVSRICTHQGCTVALPEGGAATLDCPCHGSRFEVNGQIVNGPAARPLGSFPAVIQGGEVVISLT